jgi:acetolactate synthase-1/2/3 large subunit
MAADLAKELIGALAEAGVDRLFGIPGGGPNLEKIGAGASAGMRFVLAHGETAACIMASTYGLLTGRPGVCVVTRGPGLASAVNGVAQATLDRFPLLIVSDTVPAAQARRVPHQRLAQVELLRPVTKWAGTLAPDGAAKTVRAALDLAMRAPAGAVHLDFDPTAEPQPGPSAEPAFFYRDTAEKERQFREGAVAAARELVRAARRPLFILGPEAIPWTAEVRAAVAASGAPAFTTYHAKGLVPDSAPFTAGLFTNGASERPLLEQADLIVAVGLDPIEPIPAEWRYDAPVLAINPWRLTEPYYEPAVELNGPVAGNLAAFDGMWGSDWPPDAGRASKLTTRAALAVDGAGFTPHQLVEGLQRASPDGTILTVDAGAHFLVAMPLWDAEAPRDVLISNGLATMGFSVPAAVGAALARSDRPVVCLVGDGGLGMTLAELETVARLELPITVVVFNDSALSLIEVKQGPDHGGEAAVRYRPVDFAAVARGLGLEAAVVEDAGALDRLLAGDWPSGPRLIDARIDPSAYAHVIKVTRG